MDRGVWWAAVHSGAKSGAHQVTNPFTFSYNPRDSPSVLRIFSEDLRGEPDTDFFFHC